MIWELATVYVTYMCPLDLLRLDPQMYHLHQIMDCYCYYLDTMI